jgi:hypothetical protein
VDTRVDAKHTLPLLGIEYRTLISWLLIYFADGSHFELHTHTDTHTQTHTNTQTHKHKDTNRYRHTHTNT